VRGPLYRLIAFLRTDAFIWKRKYLKTVVTAAAGEAGNLIFSVREFMSARFPVLPAILLLRSIHEKD
jgi:hypothetical protein